MAVGEVGRSPKCRGSREKGQERGKACKKAGDVNKGKQSNILDIPRYFCCWAGMGLFGGGETSYMGR
jgi:hypothetical protein